MPMNEKKFNLLTEPWILVMKEDCSVKEVSLTDALLNAHMYRALAGELPTQNAAVLRLLLAVLHAVFGRTDAGGGENALRSADDAIDRWESLWENRRFPAVPITEYLESQTDNFWLFHPTRPFWQIPAAKNGTAYDASKLNGSLSESSNKLRLFPERTGTQKTRLTYPEAARWLLYVNGFDDTSAKPSKAGKENSDGKLPSVGAGWLGRIGYISVAGDTLFETLMRNFVLLDGKGELWTSSIPAWELEKPRSSERTQIPMPHDQAALLTLQSRRLILHGENGYVTGYHLLGGDFFEKENAFSEQMTVWGPIKDKKSSIIGYQPKRHDKTRQMWRDIALYSDAESSVQPGVIRWNVHLQRNDILPKHELLRLGIASVQYGDKDFFAADIFSDEMSVQLNLLSEMGERCRARVINEIAGCDRIAYYVGELAKDIFLASGGDTEKKSAPVAAAKEQFYYLIDVPFRKWLVRLDAYDDDDELDAKVLLWRKEAESIAYGLAQRMAKDAGPAAFVGKAVKEGKNSERKYYSVSLAVRDFKYRMKTLWEVKK